MSESPVSHQSDADEVVDVVSEEATLMGQLSGVRAVNVEAFEEEFGNAMEAAIASHDVQVELRRLDRTREQIEQMEDRIRTGRKLAPARLSKLYDRLDDLRFEESSIQMRIDELDQSKEAVKVQEKEKVPPRTVSRPEIAEPAVVRKRSVPLPDSDTDDVEDKDDAYVEPTEQVEEEDVGEDVVCDDYDDDYFTNRLNAWISNRPASEGAYDFESLLSSNLLGEQPIGVGATVDVDGFKVPRVLWEGLLEYQRAGVQWLLGLFSKRTGGILGDEMGLGKTVQIVALLAALQTSGKLNSPVLVVCPVTLMKQWIREFHFWWPALRVFRLHSSDTQHSPKSVLKKACKIGHVIITSYGHLRQFQSVLTKCDWRAVVLDEGHKIRNPDAAITLACKQLRTPHRLILSGTPIQNSLTELWSLFDFIAPGHLGALPVFKAEFAMPINAGGYVNASSLQVQTSYKCACLLRDLIKTRLLRRVKADVMHELPHKQEQVLFCQISPYQRELYEFILDSDIIQSVLEGKRNILAGIDLLRKVCNHPGLLIDGPMADMPGFPNPRGEVSGKMTVVGQTLKLWKERGHKVLLFCQTRQMLDLVETFISRDTEYSYLRMDGNTSIKDRGILVDRFNKDHSIFIFLLTTRVGGLGLNLTGADRVLIFDPDWNPSTDLQARERAWRLGQTRPVTIYRLITAGTIEEKIYHRQLWKQYLTSRVLSDPKQSRFFKSSDLYDLFTLSEPEAKTVTGELFSGLNLEIRRDKVQRDNRTVPVAEDSHILESLFEMTGLHSAIQHDKLVDRPQQEVVLVEKEAERLAASAAAALQRSRQERENEPVEALTWTGRPVAQKARPSIVGGAVPSSASILASIKARQSGNTHIDEGLDQPLARVLDRLLRFFADSNGVCKSEAIAERFRDVLEPGQEAAFRRMLKTVAKFDAVSKSWKLDRSLFDNNFSS